MTRANFTAHQKRKIRQAGNYTCAIVGCGASAIEVDHIKECWEGGRNTIDNGQLLCDKHHKEKTSRKGKQRAKADRQGGKTGQYARRQKAKAKGTYRGIAQRKDPWPPKGSRKLQSRKMGTHS